MDRYEAIERAFPELATIENSDLRKNVREAWATAMAENSIDDLETVPWFPPVQRDLDLPDERLVPHVRDVTQAALALAEADRKSVV